MAYDHDHHTHGDHHHAPTAFARAFAIGILLNLSFVAIEAFFGWQVNSLALLADAGHNLSYVAGLALAWAATIATQKRPDHRHTYGWQRASILAALANALLLLVAMGSLIWEAVQRLRTPPPTEAGVVIAVAAVGVVINGITALLFMSDQKSDMNIRGAYLHMAADALVSLGVVKLVSRMSARHHQMRSQRNVRGAHTPDVEIVHADNSGATAEPALDRDQVDAVGYAIKSQV